MALKIAEEIYCNLKQYKKYIAYETKILRNVTYDLYGSNCK